MSGSRIISIKLCLCMYMCVCDGCVIHSLCKSECLHLTISVCGMMYKDTVIR